jgi:YggT family protein
MFLTSLNPFVWLIITPLDLYYYVVWALIIVNCVLALDILNRHDPFAQRLEGMLITMTYWPLTLIRKYVPKYFDIDFSPFILLFLIYCTEYAVLHSFKYMAPVAPIQGLPTRVSPP